MQTFSFRSFTCIVLFIFTQSFVSATKAWAHEGWGIVVDRREQIYFSDIPTNTIWRITREGKLERFLSNKHSHSLVLGTDGSIYGTQEHHAKAIGNVWRIAPDGTFSNIFIPNANFPVNLYSFTIDSANNIFSTNSISFPNQVNKVTLLKAGLNGNVVIVAGSVRGHKDGRGSEARFSGIDGMAWAGDGTLYVTDSVYVRRVSVDGTVTTVGGGALTTQSYGEDLMGLTISNGGSIYVADYSQRRIIELLPGGNVQTILKTGWYWSPTGVAVNGNNLYVLECLRMPLVILGDLGIGPYIRVRKISSNGKVITIATVWGRNSVAFLLIVLAIMLAVIWVVTQRRKKRRSKYRTAI